MNTSSHYGFRNPNVTMIIYPTVSDSGETASFGFENLKLQRLTKKMAFVTSESYWLFDWSNTTNKNLEFR